MDFYSIVLHIFLSNSIIVRWYTAPQKDRNFRHFSSQDWVQIYCQSFHTISKGKHQEKVHKTNRIYYKLCNNIQFDFNALVDFIL